MFAGLWQPKIIRVREYARVRRIGIDRDAFNLNHPNFDNPVAILNDPNFGRSRCCRAVWVGSARCTKVSGPRSLQIALKIPF
ncbi:MAG: hypothetical protein ACR2NN_10035 [Bryobacteraceae bacterium]